MKVPREFGATGRFPDGKIHPDDEGELTMGITLREGNVILAFGKEVAWLGMGADLAETLGQKLIEKAAELRRQQVRG